MGDTRFKNGLALGPYANFFATSANVFSQADATPDVTLGNLFFSNNTTNTTITHFDLQPPPGDTSATYSQMYEGKLIRVVFLDDSTGLANAGRLILSSSDNLQGANNSIELLYHNSSWIEFNRSYNNSRVLTVESKNLYTVGAGTGGVDVRGNVSVVRIISATGSATTIRTAVNGAQGQILTLLAIGGSDALIIVNSATNIDGTFTSVTSGSSTQFRLANSASVTFVKVNNQWLEMRPVFINSSAAGVS